MNVLAGIIAGFVGTVVITMVMAMAPRMGMPEMDMVGMLGSMISPKGNRSLGMAIHLMMGVVFALIYGLLWSLGVGTVGLVWGAIFGAGHWLVAGTMMGSMPMMHAGIKSGTVAAPGVFMVRSGGMMAFMGGLMGHVIFGLVVALVYGLFA